MVPLEIANKIAEIVLIIGIGLMPIAVVIIQKVEYHNLVKKYGEEVANAIWARWR